MFFLLCFRILYISEIKAKNNNKIEGYSFLYVNKRNVCGYPDKNSLAKCIKKIWWGDRIDITERQYKNFKKKKSSWLEITTFPLRDDAGREFSPWWIKSEDLTSEKSLKKLAENWPIESLSFDSGDFAARIKFNINGAASINSLGKQYKGHVFIGKGIVIVKYKEPEYKSILFVAGYDYKTKKIFIPTVPEGERCEVKFFKDINIPPGEIISKNLNDCSRLP